MKDHKFKDSDLKKSSFSPIQIDASCVEVAMNEDSIPCEPLKILKEGD